MSKASNRRSAAHLAAAAGIGAAIALAAQAQAEITRPPATEPAAAAPPRTDAQRVRCWQEGRLIIDEPALATTRDIPGSALKLRDPKKRDMFIATTANTTCLIQPAEERPAATIPAK